MTVIIDNSLCCMNFKLQNPEKEVIKYAQALFSAGVRYVMLDNKTIPYFCGFNTAEKYIFCLRSPDDVIIENGIDFAYTYVPLRLAYLIPQLKNPVMMDINLDDVDLKTISFEANKSINVSGFDVSGTKSIININGLGSPIDISKISCLSFSGNFTFEEGELFNFISWYRTKFALPINICPLNFLLNGVEKTIEVFHALGDSVILSFGSEYSYTPLEDAMAEINNYTNLRQKKDFRFDLANAALAYANITGRISSGIKNQIEKRLHFTIPSTPKIDEKILIDYMLESGLAFIKKNKTADTPSIPEKFVETMGIPDDMKNFFMDIIKECDMQISDDDKDKDCPQNGVLLM